MKPSMLMSLTSVLIMSGCATMSPDECRTADWYLIGELDARSGRTPAQFANRDRACREAGYPGDQQSWREGWDQGLTVFCTAPQGFRFGREGGRYERTCPATLEPGFLGGFDLGRQMFSLSERVSGLRAETQAVEAKILESSKSDSLDVERLAELERQSNALQRILREAELELAELNGLAKGLGLL
jgi:hypothetical protein